MEGNLGGPNRLGKCFGNPHVGSRLSFRRSRLGYRPGMANGRAGRLRMCFHERGRRVRCSAAPLRLAPGSCDIADEPRRIRGARLRPSPCAPRVSVSRDLSMTIPNISMADSCRDPNISTYNEPAIAEYYAALDYLTPCEN